MDDKLCVDNFKKVVEDNMGLVGSISKKYSRYSRFSYDDIFQVGCIGLIKAARNFDVHKGYKFSTYAYIKIKGEILLFLRSRTKFFDSDNNVFKQISDVHKITYPLSLDYVIKDSSVKKQVVFSEIISDNFNLEEYISLRLDIKNCIDKLPRMYQKILVLKSEGFKQREIAQIIGISQNSVSRYYRNACRKVRKYLSDYICNIM
jgi:RNA polymerase sporulation-specific sigma factor